MLSLTLTRIAFRSCQVTVQLKKKKKKRKKRKEDRKHCRNTRKRISIPGRSLHQGEGWPGGFVRLESLRGSVEADGGVHEEGGGSLQGLLSVRVRRHSRSAAVSAKLELQHASGEGRRSSSQWVNLVARFFPIKISLELHSLAKIVAGEVSLEAANIYASPRLQLKCTLHV